MDYALQIKTDLINELRNKIYYNQIEIQRILNKDTTISYKDSIEKLCDLLSENVVSLNSIELMEQYLPSSKEDGSPKNEHKPE